MNTVKKKMTYDKITEDLFKEFNKVMGCLPLALDPKSLDSIYKDISTRYDRLYFNTENLIKKYESQELLYHINCEVCGKAIWRKNGFDVRCDKHPWQTEK